MQIHCGHSYNIIQLCMNRQVSETSNFKTYLFSFSFLRITQFFLKRSKEVCGSGSCRFVTWQVLFGSGGGVQVHFADLSPVCDQAVQSDVSWRNRHCTMLQVTKCRLQRLSFLLASSMFVGLCASFCGDGCAECPPGGHGRTRICHGEANISDGRARDWRHTWQGLDGWGFGE